MESFIFAFVYLVMVFLTYAYVSRSNERFKKRLEAKAKEQQR